MFAHIMTSGAFSFVVSMFSSIGLMYLLIFYSVKLWTAYFPKNNLILILGAYIDKDFYVS